MGAGTWGTVSYFLEMGFVNDGRACIIGSKAGLFMTARTDTHRLVRANLSNRRFPIRHREHVTLVIGTSWRLRARCALGKFSSVVVHSRRGSQTVSFPRNPYLVCTPAATGFYFMRFPA